MKNSIEKFWNIKETSGIKELKKDSEAISIISGVIQSLDSGKIRVAEKHDNKWIINEWVKKAILLFLGVKDCKLDENKWYDKVQSKFTDWSEKDFESAKIRAVPGCFVRKGAFFEESVIIMPSFVNIGVHVGSRTMIDSLTTIGSCVQIGKDCHISSNTVLAGVIEPVQSSPVIVEDYCFVGAGCQIAEGVIIREGSVIGAGVTITGATKIVDRNTGIVSYGEVPSGSVVVGGSVSGANGINTNCAVIIKQVDSGTRSKVSINDLLRH